jgi:hypothetical protein
MSSTTILLTFTPLQVITLLAYRSIRYGLVFIGYTGWFLLKIYVLQEKVKGNIQAAGKLKNLISTILIKIIHYKIYRYPGEARNPQPATRKSRNRVER